MRKLFIAAALLCASCAGEPKQEIPLLDKSAFEQKVGDATTSLYTLRGGDLVMQVTDFGGRIVSLWTPDKDGKMGDVAVGHATIGDYINAPVSRVVGAAVGPVANRIGRGEFEIDGKKYTLELNNNGNTIHSGPKGFDQVVWKVAEQSANSIKFVYNSPDGEFGFPGNRKVEMTYTLTPENELAISYKLTTDAATPVNMTNHSFFNLGEEGSSVCGYIMSANASHYTPVDENTLPTGEIAPVEGTPYDFRTAHAIGDNIEAAGGYDNNFVIDNYDGSVKSAVTVYDPVTGRTMEVLTDQPGIQIYSAGSWTGKSIGKYGNALGKYASLALETQKFPDAMHHENFPSIIVRPDKPYTHTCIYRFGVK